MLTFVTDGMWIGAGCSRRMTGEEIGDERRMIEDSAGQIGRRSGVWLGSRFRLDVPHCTTCSS